ncbi:MAG: proline--tRNA ligase [Planctomycetota bacterium]|jgi:prolyl-tRNA synthetase
MAQGFTPRSEDFPRWYQEVVQAADLAENAPVRGCMVIKPHGYALWENIQGPLDRMFKETGHQNVGFPLLIPQSFLEKEAAHVEGFAPELAVVTHGGGKKLEEPLVVRPTSETVIGHMWSKWIQSHRDLPMLMNQWCSVVRWEMRPRLFLRTTEFWWQEGHTAHATAEEAEAETLQMLGIYRQVCEEYMAIPVHEGPKSRLETFPGADCTYCVEALMQDGKALQMATSHNLGQNFAKAFDIQFQTKEGGREHVFTTSWGLSTRTIGALVMVHGDDKGLVLPPKVAPVQAVLVPIFRKPEEKAAVMEACEKVSAEMKAAGVRFRLDDRDNMKPGPKFFEWEKKGVPVRLEVGPRDLADGQAVLVRRDAEGKTPVPLDGLAEHVVALLDTIQSEMLARAKARLAENTRQAATMEEFVALLDADGGFVEAWTDGTDESELAIKEKTKATIRVVLEDKDDSGQTCFATGKPATRRALFARSY